MPSMSHATRIGIGASSPVDKQIEFISCGVRRVNSHIESPGIRGTRSHYDNQVVEGTYDVSGPLVIDCRPDVLDLVLARILGAGPTTEVYSLAETVPEFDLLVDKVVDIYLYADLKVSRATFTSARNQPLQLTLELLGKTEVGEQTFPSISATLSTMRPYVHHNLVATLGGSAHKVDNVEIVIDNGLATDNYWNSQARQEAPETDRNVTVAMDLPFTATEEAAFYNLALTGIVGELKWSQSTDIFVDMDFPKLQLPSEGPTIPAKNSELRWRPTFRARRTTSAAELSITNSTSS